jgi:hypothetical protein
MISRTIAKVIIYIHKHNITNFEYPVVKKYTEYYCENPDFNLSYTIPSKKSGEALKKAYSDALEIEQLCKDLISNSEAYKLLVRMIDEQGKESKGGKKLKENAELKASSMQTPVDPDATYREKKGKKYKGYSVNIEETCTKELILITDYEMETNIHDDTQFIKDKIEKEKGEKLEVSANDSDHSVSSESEETKPTVMITDGGYISDETLKLAEANNVLLVGTALKGIAPDPMLNEFQINTETKEIEKCPAGHSPLSSSYDAEKGYRACFDKCCCEKCPYLSNAL